MGKGARNAKTSRMFLILFSTCFATTAFGERAPTLADIRKSSAAPLKIQATGKREAIEPMMNGQIHGTARYYNPNGQLSSTIEYVHGKQTGKQIHYRANGSLEKIVMYKDGLPHGDQMSFYDTGELKREWTSVNGVTEGIEREYDKDGYVMVAIEYRAGKEVSKEKFDRNGRTTAATRPAPTPAPVVTPEPVTAPVKDMKNAKPQSAVQPVKENPPAPSPATRALERMRPVQAPAPAAAKEKAVVTREVPRDEAREESREGDPEPERMPADEEPGASGARDSGSVSGSFPTFDCTSDLGEQRRLHIEPQPGAGCKTFYTKNNKAQMIFHSRKLTGDCVKAATKLANKLEAANFTCERHEP